MEIVAITSTELRECKDLRAVKKYISKRFNIKSKSIKFSFPSGALYPYSEEKTKPLKKCLRFWAGISKKESKNTFQIWPVKEENSFEYGILIKLY